jgi:hypothetical protein
MYFEVENIYLMQQLEIPLVCNEEYSRGITCLFYLILNNLNLLRCETVKLVNQLVNFGLRFYGVSGCPCP